MARHFEDWLKAYMAFTADSESPDEFHFWTGVSTIAGALRRRVWVDMRKFQWTANFYIILVGPPGIATKSTSIRTGIKMLEKVEGVHFGPPSMTWQKLVDSLSASVEHMPFIDPYTGEEKHLPMSCLTIPISELGTFLKIDDSAMMDVLVDLWDGQVGGWSHGTKTTGTTEIKNPWMNIIGCTTPAWLKAHFPEHMIGGGLTSRIVFVYGEKKRQLVPYPDEIRPGLEYRELEQKLTEDLQLIGQMCGEISLSREAREWGHAWYKQHWTGDRAEHLSSDRYGGYIARKQTHIHKLAIVLSAAESSAMKIERHHLEKAEALLASVEPHMIRVFESIGVVNESKNVKELLPFIRAVGFITPDALWAKVMAFMPQKEFNEALHAAARAGLIQVVDRNGVRGLAATPLQS